MGWSRRPGAIRRAARAWDPGWRAGGSCRAIPMDSSFPIEGEVGNGAPRRGR